MNLLYIDHYVGGPAYGMEYRPFYLAREWVRMGHRVLIAGASFAHVRSRQPAVGAAFVGEQVEGVEFIWCKTPAYAGNGIGRVVNMAAFLRRLGQWRRWLPMKPDAVIASSTYPADIGPARRIARAHGASLVWEVHDLWPLSPIELGGMSRFHPFILWMQNAENLACRSADLVVSMLPKAQAHLLEHGMAPGRFVYVPNGVDPAEWHDETPVTLPPEHSSAIAAARERGHVLAAYAGAHGVANDLHTLIDAAALMRGQPVTWLLVGSGPEKAGLARRANDLKLDNMVLLEPVPKVAIPTLLRAMDLLYLGLRPEPLFRFGISPNKLMDYMMAGRPVVCAIAAGNDPVGEAGCGLTVAPGDAAAVAQAASQLSRLTSEERRALGQRGQDYVRSRHLYPVLARRFIEAIQSHERRTPAR
ncbi:MAG TPA: glycosyltransferase family 4 protein [Burkholderiaceae bacterium]